MKKICKINPIDPRLFLICGAGTILLLGCTNNQTQSAIRLAFAEAKAGEFNRAQQIYRVENDHFATSFNELKIESASGNGYTATIIDTGVNKLTRALVYYQADDRRFDRDVMGCVKVDDNRKLTTSVIVSDRPGVPINHSLCID